MSMKWMVSLVVCVILLCVCLFGFFATFEPGAKNAMAFRFAYAIVGLSAIRGIGVVFLRWKKENANR